VIQQAFQKYTKIKGSQAKIQSVPGCKKDGVCNICKRHEFFQSCGPALIPGLGFAIRLTWINPPSLMENDGKCHRYVWDLY
jgi:hypothetical protein